MSSDNLDEVRRAIVARLRADGFSFRGNTFRRETPELVHVISLQRSRSNTAQTVRFTLNVGIASKRLLEGDGGSLTACKIEDCHWRRRAGSFSDEPEDKWWCLNVGDPAQPVVTSIEDVLVKRILPALASLRSDSALASLWLAGHGVGLTEAQRLIYASRLTRALGMREEAQAVLAEMRDLLARKSIPLVRVYLAKIGEKEDK